MKKIRYILLCISIMSCSTIKIGPEGVNYESPIRKTNIVDFHYDLTYLDKNGNIKYDRNLWDATYKVVDNAKDYLIIEMFLLNDIYNKDTENFPNFAEEYVKRVIKKKRENPNLKVYILLDENNNMYGAFEHPFITKMKESGIEIIEVGIMKLKDTFPWYSPIWRNLIEPFGNPKNKGWISNFYGPMWPKLSLRNVLRGLNIKADHKKVFLNENEVVVSSANIHDPSYFHENVALYTNGEIVNDVLDNLKKVAKFSNSKIEIDNMKNNIEKVDVVEKKSQEIETLNNENEEEYKIKYLSESKIGENLDKDLDSTDNGDEILMGMYFLADKNILKKLIEASNRGVKIRIILDRSQDAFGMSTNGLPNKPVSKKLRKKTDKKIEIKWYFTNNEQYHTKLIMIKKINEEAIIYTGSANMIKKNIRGYIMDSNFRVIANKNSKLVKDIDTYFDRLWNNKDGIFTLEYDDEPTTKIMADFMYEIFNFTQLGSF